MPHSRLEWSLVAVGVVALGVLVWLIVPAWHRYERQREATQPALAKRVPGSGQPSLSVLGAESSVGTRDAQSRAGQLTLVAVRGDCWIVVRAGSSSGEQLYAGTLAAQKSISFRGRRFWVSLGAATNIDARFNGKPLQGFPHGTANVAINGASARLAG
jgi:uncharacterized protein DUF4115